MRIATQQLYKFRPVYSELYIPPKIENDTIMQVIRLRIKSMSATSGPPIGPVLGQYAIQISKFCNEFNERSNIYNEGVYVFVTLFHYADGTYQFDMFAHASSMLIKRSVGILRGAGRRRGRRFYVTPYQLFEAVMYKYDNEGYTDHYFSPVAFFKSGLGTARAMGLRFLKGFWATTPFNEETVGAEDSYAEVYAYIGNRGQTHRRDLVDQRAND